MEARDILQPALGEFSIQKIISDGELTNQNAAPYKERTATADEARPIQGHRIAAVMLASHVRCLINARPAQKWEGHAPRPYGTLA